MADGRHLENVEKLLYLSRGSSGFDEIWRADAVRPYWPSRPIKIWNFKNPRWRRLPSWKIENRHISAAVWAISTKSGMIMQFNPLERPTVKSLKFYKSKMAAEVMDLWTRLWGRYHVPQYVFLVNFLFFLFVTTIFARIPRLNRKTDLYAVWFIGC